jgi:predicted outer membrane repeat protein
MSLFSWLRGSNGMADPAPMARFRRQTTPSRPAPHFRPRLEVLEDRTVPSTFHVADVAGLQAAVAAVNANPTERAIILLAPGTYDLTSELAIANPSHLVIQGDPSGNVVLDNPTHSDRIIEIQGPGDVTINGLVISGGATTDLGGGILAANATLTLDHCTLSGNSAVNNGGGIYSDTILTVNHSTIAGNSTLHGRGGGICIEFGVGLTVKDTTISDNSAAYYGGGIYDSYATLTLDHDTLSRNSATYGGGIFDYGSTLIVNQSMLSANSATYGGGIYAYYATAEIDYSTVNDPVGGGIANVGGTVHLKNTVVDGVLYQDQDYP